MRKDVATFDIYTSCSAAFHIFSFDRLMNWVNGKADNIVLLSHTSLQVLKRKGQILSRIISCMILSPEAL